MRAFAERLILSLHSWSTSSCLSIAVLAACASTAGSSTIADSWKPQRCFSSRLTERSEWLSTASQMTKRRTDCRRGCHHCHQRRLLSSSASSWSWSSSARPSSVHSWKQPAFGGAGLGGLVCGRTTTLIAEVTTASGEVTSFLS